MTKYSFTDQVRNRIRAMDKNTEFSLENLQDISPNISCILAKLCALGEITFKERRKIPGTKVSRNFYYPSTLRPGGKKEETTIHFQGWENVYPEFFTLPSFPIIQIIRVGELR